jgi:hypothetical protein
MRSIVDVLDVRYIDQMADYAPMAKIVRIP